MSCTAERWERTSRRRLTSMPHVHCFPQRRSESELMKQTCFIKTKQARRYSFFPLPTRDGLLPTLVRYLVTEIEGGIQAGGHQKIGIPWNDRSALPKRRIR